MGSGGGTSKTTTNQDPWSGQAPYLRDVFGHAQQVFNNSLNQGLYKTPQSPLYQTYLNEAIAQGTGVLPQEAQVNATWNQAMQAPSILAPHITEMVRSGYNPNAAIPALADSAASQWAQPFVQAASNVANTENPALDYLNQTASGQYLTPDTNPYLQQSVQNALDQANATIASQFNRGGRYGSGMMAGTQAQELGKIATSAYGNAYEQERQRQEAAKQALGQLTQGQMGQQLSAIMGAGSLAGNQQQLGQQALSTLGSFSGEDLNRQLQARQSQVQDYLQALGLSSNALNFAPVMQGMGNEQLGQLANAAQVQQQLLQMPEQAAWDRIANYLAMIQGNYGGTSTARAPGSGSNLGGQIMGGLTTGIGLASMFSSRELKNEVSQIDPAQVADGVLGLPINTWNYTGTDEIHIGPYAEDFRAQFGVGDGITIAYADMFGVLFATVQHLLVKNAELTDRVEELENAI